MREMGVRREKRKRIVRFAWKAAFSRVSSHGTYVAIDT